MDSYDSTFDKLIQRVLGFFGNERDISVFINCPYDKDYEQLFDAAFFTIVSCGFVPRGAFEIPDSCFNRIEKIKECLQSSKYSIHDLSRCQGEGNDNLARMNMPFELGLSVMQQLGISKKTKNHEWFVLVTDCIKAKRFISDLNAYDLTQYDATISDIISKIVNWLCKKPEVDKLPTPKSIFSKLPSYIDQKCKLMDDYKNTVPFSELYNAATSIAMTYWE